MKNDISWHHFDNLPEQSSTLAHRVADDIKRCLTHKPQVTLCVPGGNTPALFLKALSKIELDWHRVNILLNDERWVPLSDEKSNQAMLLRTLENGYAKAANIIAFYPPSEKETLSREDFLKQFNGHYFYQGGTQDTKDSSQFSITSPPITPLEIDICVLGMGEDGHTASLFPDMLNLSQALDPKLSPALISADPPDKEARVSLNLSALLSAQYHYLLITGKTKESLIYAAQKANTKQQSTRLPIEHLIEKTSLAIYYSH
ncbi:MAG: 6-phosphogluconolactonase [Cellvibrionaceae bacterium]